MATEGNLNINHKQLPYINFSEFTFFHGLNANGNRKSQKINKCRTTNTNNNNQAERVQALADISHLALLS